MTETEIKQRICPHCGSSIAIGATFCPNCTRRVLSFVECPECLEPIAKTAKYCPYCGQRIRRYKTGRKLELPPLDLTIRARRLGMLIRSLSLTGFMRPMVIHANSDRILISQWSAFGLDRDDREIELDTIRDIEGHHGFFWRTVIIHPKDEEADEVVFLRGLPKRDARILIHRLTEELRQHRSHRIEPERTREDDGE